VRPHRDWREYRLYVELTQRVAFRGVLDRVCDEFGGAVSIRPAKNERSAAIAALVTWTRTEIRPFLEILLPHLIAKRERAETALAYLDLVATQVRHALPRTTHGQWAGRSRLSDANLGERHVFFERMHQLNKLGS
jgi:hypothetical protein